MEPWCNVGIVKDATVGIMASPRRLGSAVVRRHPIPVVLFLSLPDLIARVGRGIFPRTLSASLGPGNGIPPTRMHTVACPLHGPVIRVRGDRELRSMNRFTRRAALVGASALPFAAAGPVRAQAKFPDRPIRLIIPWAAGGPADAGFRILAQSVSKKLGQQVIVDNKAGASGIMGAIALQEAKPDGYTISQMHMSVLRQPLLNKQLTYNPINDLTYILQITGFIMGVVVKADAPWKTLPELLAYAKANPGKLNWGTLGIGSTQHLAMERVGLAQGGLSWTHAPYRGTADTLRALLGGEIDFASESSGWAPMVEAGQLRLLAVFTAQRAKRFPNVPTVKELGIDVVIDSPGGLIGPKGMDPAVVAVLADAFRAAAQEPEHLKFLENMDQPLILLDGPAYKAAMAKTYEEEKELLRRLNLLPA
jgi:tripartite-type tricarboxylate transporter receptor subunit TctC